MRRLRHLRGGGLTLLCLLGGLASGVILGALVHDGLPGHIREGSRTALAALAALTGTVLGGAAWGRAMASLHGLADPGRRALVGALGFGLPVIGVGLALGAAEGLLVERGAAGSLPIHLLFLLLFVPAAGAVATAGSWSMLTGRPQRLLDSLRCGAGGALAFALVALVMDLAGWRVGAPGAAERATMIKVLSLGAAGAAVVAGSVLSARLSRPVQSRL